MRRIEIVRTRVPASQDFRAFVRRHLYPDDWVNQGAYPGGALSTGLLGALGAILGPSARGGVSDVMSLNFDDALECYLRAEGHPIQPVADPGGVLRGDVDVRIHHFHGYLPLADGDTWSTSLVFSQAELVARLGAQGSYWETFLRSQILTKVFLIVGTSLEDTDVEVLLRQAGSELNGSRPLGFVIDRRVSADRRRILEESGLAVTSVAEYGEIPGFLRQVCEIAANGPA